jgi:hypothetical protein
VGADDVHHVNLLPSLRMDLRDSSLLRADLPAPHCNLLVLLPLIDELHAVRDGCPVDLVAQRKLRRGKRSDQIAQELAFPRVRQKSGLLHHLHGQV